MIGKFLMKKLLLYTLISLLTLSAFAQKDEFVGFYKGEASGKGYPLGYFPDTYAEVYKGPNGYRLKVLSEIMARSETHCVIDNLIAKDGAITFENAGVLKLTGKITPAEIIADGTFKNKPLKLWFKRMNLVSPTMGMKAPAGAVVLFDGKDTSAWERVADGEPCTWEIKDGAMVISMCEKTKKWHRNTIRTKQSFEAIRMHLEFKTPAEYNIEGRQGRGNSGVIFGGCYEVQVLDSFGAEGSWDECGSIYRMHPPKVNASLEPEAWQTYDIEFHPAVYNGEHIVKYPTFTVWHNGVLLHKDVEVYASTSIGPRKWASFKHPRNGVQIHLQDHSNRIAYRNIWVQPIK